MLAVKQCADVHTATLFQYIAHRFMTGYDFAGHLARLRALYGRKCALMLDRMERSFHPSVRFNRPEGGMFVMAFLPEGMDAKPFVQQAVRAGVACVPGMAFSTDQSRPSNGFRMNYSMPSDADIVRGVDILGPPDAPAARLTHPVLSALFLCSFFSFFCSFFSFGKRKERTKEKKPYRGGGCAQTIGQPSPKKKP